VAEYVSVFVAQYTGAKVPERVGAVLWQGIYFSLGAALFLMCFVFLAEPLFALGEHSLEIQRLEVIYFQILCAGSGVVLLTVTLSCFYSGRGMTWPVAIVNGVGAMVNIPLDYALINGKWGFPEMGIAGAGIATVVGALVTLILFAFLVFSPKNSALYGLRTQWRFEGHLFRRFLRFGLPGGVQLFLDMFGITFFIFMVGRLGRAELAATNIVISIELLAYLPLIGLSIATSVLVGQSIGAKRPHEGQRAATSATHIGLLYMTFAALIFLIFPEALMGLFRTRDEGLVNFNEVIDMGVVLLRFVAFYCIINAPALIWFGGLKGAGDIAFVMWTLGCSSIFIMVLPTYILLEYMDSGLYEPWFCIIAYVIAIAVAGGLRFKGGKWKNMSVIESDLVASAAK
jgi:MATE family multidrug resistance protein